MLGDQLDPASAALDGIDPRLDRVWMAEVPEEATHVWSHKARIALFLAAMRHFGDALRERGVPVEYHALGTHPHAGLADGEGFAIDASVIKADASRARGVPGSEATDWRKEAGTSRAMREYLDALEEFNPPGDDDAEPPHPPAPGKNVSLTDPAARWTAAPGGPAFYGYSTNYLIDLEAGIIVDVEATPAHRTQEVESTKTMVNRVEQRFGIKPDRLVGDTAYGTGPMLGCDGQR